VAASCAIPGFFRSVEIDGVRYVDGGVHCASNLDLLAHEHLDLVIALNPMSSLHASAPRTLGERLAYAVREASGRRLGSEARQLREAGTDVVLIQPTVHDLDAMGTNLMSRSRRKEVIRTAVRSVTEHLHASPLGERLAELPRGLEALVSRPAWRLTASVSFPSLARARWEGAAESAPEASSRRATIARS
jgi:NTE family protein